MAVAMIYPEPEKLKRKGSGSLQNKELSGGYLSKARTIIEWEPGLADNVLTQ